MLQLERENGLNIIAFGNDTSSRKWRFDGIAQRFLEHTNHEMFVTPYSTWNGNLVGANLVILEMLTNVNMVHACHEQGAKVIFEADDAYIDAYKREDRKNLQHIDETWRKQAIETIDACDAITVTNRYLAENFAKFTKKPIYILPNYIDLEWYGREKRLPIRRATDEIRIGWFGSKGHYEDLRMVVNAVKRVVDKYPRVKFIYLGYGGMSSDKGSTEIRSGEDVFKEIPRNRREFIRGVEPDLWPMKHRLADLDIGLAPLIDDYFNHCKTPIKWMEYAVTGAPSVVSPTVYEENPETKDGEPVVKHGVNGFVARTEDEWFEYISRLVEDETLRKQIAEQAYQDVISKWNIDNKWKDWDWVYRTVCGVPEM